MRILYAGNTLRGAMDYGVVDWLKDFRLTIYMRTTADLIFDIFFTDNEADIIFISEELESINNQENFPRELQEQVEKLENSEFFPITLGEVCRELCKKKGKREPVIVIIIELEKFQKKERNIRCMIEKSNMEYVRPSSNDIIRDLAEIIDKVEKGCIV